MTDYFIGQKVMHPLHGVGKVERIEEKSILGTTNRFSEIYFSGERLRIMVNLDSTTNMIRSLIGKDEIPKVFKFFKSSLRKGMKGVIRSSERYNLYMKKIKSADIFQMAEVIKDLTDLKKVKKLSSKEENMLKRTKKILSTEISEVKEIPQEEAELLVEQIVKSEQN